MNSDGVFFKDHLPRPSKDKLCDSRAESLGDSWSIVSPINKYAPYNHFDKKLTFSKLWQHPWPADTISTSLNHQWSLDQIVLWFLLPPTRGITHFFTDTQNTTEKIEEKNKRTNTDLGQLQAQEGLSLCDTFCTFCVSVS